MSRDDSGMPRLRSAARVLARAAVVAALWLFGMAQAMADWRADIGTFRIGIVAEPGREETIAGLAELKKAYTLALGIPVEFFVAGDYQALIEAQASRRVEYAIYSATAYATASLACSCVTPLVAPTASNGAIGLRSVLITRAADFTELSAIAKHRVAISGPEDVTGAVLPLAMLRKQGVIAAGDAPFLVRAATAEQAQSLFLAGTVDAMFGWVETGIGKTPLPGSGTLETLAQAGLPAAELRVVWTSELLRYGPHAIRTDLDAEIRRRLIPFLTGLNATDPDIFALLERHHTGGFAAVDEADYATAIDTVRAVSGF